MSSIQNNNSSLSNIGSGMSSTTTTATPLTSSTSAAAAAVAAGTGSAAVTTAVAVLKSNQQTAASDRTAAVNTAKALLSGAVAGAVSRTVTSPLERLKVMRQVQATGTKYQTGLFQAFVQMYREEGIRAYWKGNGTNVARIAPSSAVQFFGFDAYKRWLLPNDEKDTLRILAAGALSGTTGAVLLYPLDLVRSFLSVQTTKNQYSGIVHCMRTIVANEGVIGLYRGLVPTVMGIAPYVAFNFATFDLLKRHYLPSPQHNYFDLINLSLGAAAGGVAAAITYPTDVVRRRMQLQGFKDFNLPRYDSTWHCIRTTVATEGVKGLYKGMVPCFLKVVPSMAIAFMIYERMRTLLKFDPPKGSISKG